MNTTESNNQNQNTPKVSIPIYSHNVGFYRYNYEKEQLEFINHQTKVVTAFWEIPLDQWENIPSHEAYCKSITKEADKNIEMQTAAKELDNKHSRFLVLSVMGHLLAMFILIWLFASRLGIYTLFIALAIPLIGIPTSIHFYTSHALKKAERIKADIERKYDDIL